MTEFLATLVIDAHPGGKKFQGVWLEHGDENWVVDYRARELWKPFDGLTVRVTGNCYEPVGQAIGATHFQIATLQVVDPKQARRFRALGAEQTLEGTFVRTRGDAGTKSAGSDQVSFEVTGGPRYEVIGGDESALGAATVVARIVEVNPAWAATTGGPHLWIVDAHEPGWTADPTYAKKLVPCATSSSSE